MAGRKRKYTTEVLESIVDEYFNTKFSAQCDYSLVHFSSEKVLINIMNHACKSGWCESKEL